ncbi:hypothetical protein [Aurantiacibacter marinus]|uniref:VanZ-like domain-containing protein n=1 Tax=Aurantiacibacter marinus TaxID=874156 RepID=A0A0H0XMW6_9SPHN|nr:hypothetical protein [Aurantiacibacter marinus]KLI63709.1 hypothetical protein AAV99_08230 [Aurantiacibacter marinus]
MMRLVWFLAIAATLWFAFIPPSWGGLGGAGYHGVAFVVLGVLTPAAFPKLRLVTIWTALVMLGGGIELAQGTTSLHRHGEWSDFVTDVIAATVGVVYYRIWLYLRGVMAPGESAVEEEGDSAQRGRVDGKH